MGATDDRYYIGVDVGTYESKGVVIDARCHIVGQATQKHGLENPQPGYFEHDAEEVWWGDVCHITRRLLADTGLAPEKIFCVGISALGCDCLAVDENCTPLHKAILYGIDSRASSEIEYINEYFKDERDNLFAHPLVSSSVAPKILWLKNNRPEVYAAAHKFLTATSFITAKLCGNYTIDKYLAPAFAPLYDLAHNQIDETHCRLFCRPDQLAQIGYATDIAGTITPPAAAQTGLAVGTKVIVGSGDSGSEAISAGVLRPGDIMVQLGSTAFFIYYAERMVYDNRLWPGPFIVPESYCIAAGTNTAGILTRWCRDTLFDDLLKAEDAGGRNAYDAMLDAIRHVPPGSNGLVVLPYFAGERTPINDPLAKGMIFGLQVTHTRGDIYKAALEGICYSIWQHFDILSENDLPVNRIMITGGGAKSPEWLQIIADMLGRTIHISPVSIGASYGGAVMANLADGACANWAELSDRIGNGIPVHPNMENHRIYCTYRPIFDELYHANRGFMHQIC